MKSKYILIVSTYFLFNTLSCAQQTSNQKEMKGKINKTEEEWKQILSKQQFEILRKKGTERAFSGDLLSHHDAGVYSCAGCQQELFSSNTKFDSGSGWPSFYDAINENNIEIIQDKSLGMLREEIVCGRCGGHLGHVFPDGPQPTGLRYCVNSASLDFKKE